MRDKVDSKGRPAPSDDESQGSAPAAHEPLRSQRVARTSSLEEAYRALVDCEKEACTRLQSLENAQRIARIGSWDWDLVRDRLDWSEGVYELFAFDRNEVEPSFQLIVDRMHPADREWVLAALDRALVDPVALLDLDHRIVLPNGDELIIHVAGEALFDDDGRAVVMSGTVQDITERVMLERALHEREQRLASVLEASASPIVGMDLRGRITVFNAAASKTFGFRPEEVLGESVETILVSGLQINDSGTRGQGSGLQMAGRRKCGEQFPLEVHVSTTAGESELVLTLHDVSARRLYAERAATSLKMEAMGQVAAGVAHEFNNLLMMISGCLEILRDGSEEDVHSVVDDLLVSVRRAKGMTGRLEAFVGAGETSLEFVPLAASLDAFIRLARPMLGAAYTLTASFEPDLGRIWTAQHELDQALLNLVVNARDAMPSGGTITITARTREVETASFLYGHTLVQPGRYIELVVEDHGVGMSDEVKQRALDPFFTTKSKGQATGLGLSMVYGLMQRSEGYITIESAPGQGTEVSLLFQREERPSSPRPTFPAAKASLEGCRVLVVDDEPSLLRVVTRFFESEGCEVHTAESASDGLRRLEELGRVDLLVSDVVMPGGIDGIELAQQTLGRGGTKILLMSGYATDLGERLEQLGDEIVFLAKPFARKELVRAARALVGSATITFSG